MLKLRSKFSARVLDLEPSPICDILAVIDRPGLISFAGGLPSTDPFPDLDLLGMPPAQLQYGPTESDPDLRAWIAADLGRGGLACTAEQVLIVSGSQQGIDLVAKLFIDPGTPTAVESPIYLAALQVFRFFGARLRSFASTAARDLTTSLQGHAFAYAIPNFQNPTGHCFSSAQRTARRACRRLRCDANPIV